MKPALNIIPRQLITPIMFMPILQQWTHPGFQVMTVACVVLCWVTAFTLFSPSMACIAPSGTMKEKVVSLILCFSGSYPCLPSDFSIFSVFLYAIARYRAKFCLVFRIFPVWCFVSFLGTRFDVGINLKKSSVIIVLNISSVLSFPLSLLPSFPPLLSLPLFQPPFFSSLLVFSLLVVVPFEVFPLY